MNEGVQFPIFLKDKDNWMYMVGTQNEIGFLERIDIEENEYIGWDINGRRVNLSLVGKDIFVVLLEKDPKIEDLKKAILDFAKRVKPGTDLLDQSRSPDIVNLFLTAKQGKRV